MKTLKIVFGLALVAIVAVVACEKEIPSPFTDEMVDKSQVIEAGEDKQVSAPDRLGISKVIVTDFSIYNDAGEFWDEDKNFDVERYPDIYVVIHNAQWKMPDLINTEAEYIANANPKKDFQWEFERSIEVPEPWIEHRIALYDYDDLSKTAELMHEEYFNPFDGANGYPASIELNSKVASFVVELDYKWYKDAAN